MELKVLDFLSLPPRVPSSQYLGPSKPDFSQCNFPTLSNSRLILASKREETDKIPVWVMRQAGRYLEEFRTFRQNYDFFTMCTSPELAAELTLMPIRRYSLDAAIIFSDILVLPQAMGLEVRMEPGIGPVFPAPLAAPSEISRLRHPDIETAFEAYFNAIYLTRHSLQGKVPLLGFSGGPFTLFTYMIEGQGSRTFTKARKWVYAHPIESHDLLSKLTRACCEFLLGQIYSGAQAVQVFESHAGLLGPQEFSLFLLPYIRQIASFLKEKVDVPLIIFCKDAGWALEDLCKTEFDVIGLDWIVDPEWAVKLARSYNKALQGNFDPACLYSSKESIEERTIQMKEKFGSTGYIANLGHGIYPDVDPAHLEIFINTVHR